MTPVPIAISSEISLPQRRLLSRDQASAVVVSLYRLAKLAQLHDLKNQAFVRQVDETEKVLNEYCNQSGGNFSILFARRATFVAGQLLRATRAGYEQAGELATLLERCGGTELNISRGATGADLMALAEGISQVTRGRTFAISSSRIRLRAVSDQVRLRGIEVEDLDAELRAFRHFSSAVVVVRRFFDEVRAGSYVLPKRVKRIAQRLVDLAQDPGPGALGATEGRNAQADEAGQAVNTTLLAVAMTRELVADRGSLSTVALAALLHDCGRIRAQGMAAARASEFGVAHANITNEEQVVSTVIVATAMGRIQEDAIKRTVVACESEAARLRVPWPQGRVSTVQATIIAIARRYIDALVTGAGEAGLTPERALLHVAEGETDAVALSVLRLLAAVVGILPRGTTVRLSTGETAQVASHASAASVVRLRVLGDLRTVVREIDRPVSDVVQVLSVDGWQEPAMDPPVSSFDNDVDDVVSLIPLDDDAQPIELEAVPASRSAADVAATLRGDFGATPLVQLLAYLLEYRLDGTLALEPGDKALIHFTQGVPDKMRIGVRIALLGEEVVRLGLVPEEVVSRALTDAPRIGAHLGEYLVSSGHLQQSTLESVLRAQLVRRVAVLANVGTDTTYAFFAGADPLNAGADDPRVNCHPLDCILAVAKEWKEKTRMRAAMTQLRSRALPIHAACELDSLWMLEDERRVVAFLQREGPTLDELLSRRIARDEVLLPLLFTLLVARQFAFFEDPIGVVDELAVVPKARESFLPPSSIVTADGMFDSKSAPGLKRPSQVPPPGFVLPAAPKSRPPPTRDTTPDGDGASATVQPAFHQALTSLSVGNLVRASELARTALDVDPSNPDFAALHVYLQALVHGGGKISEAIAMLSATLRANDVHLLSRVYRARLYKQMGRVVDAREDFRRVLQLEPSHVEAQNEVAES